MSVGLYSGRKTKTRRVGLVKPVLQIGVSFDMNEQDNHQSERKDTSRVREKARPSVYPENYTEGHVPVLMRDFAVKRRVRFPRGEHS